MAPPTPRPQSSSYPKFDAANAGLSLNTAEQKEVEEGDIGADIPRRNSSDPSSSSSTSSSSTSKKGDKSSMQNLRGVFLSKEEREKQGLGKKAAGGAMKSASVPGPLKSAMKPRSGTAAMDYIPNSDPLPVDREALTGLLNHETSQLQQLANRAEKLNEWWDHDLIVISRLTSDLKAASEAASGKAPSIRLTEADGSSSAPFNLVTAITDQIMEINYRLEHMTRWRKDLEHSVYWRREEYRRIEKAMGRKKSGQSGAVNPSVRNVGFNEQKAQKQSKLGIASGDKNDDEVDTEKNRNTLAELEAKLQAGMSLEDATEDQKPLREQDYARDRWTSSLSRLPTQTEWEELVGPKTLQKK